MFNQKETPGHYIWPRNQIFVFFLYSFYPLSQGLEVLLLSFLANNHTVFLESKMAQPQFLALLSDLPVFAVWDLLGQYPTLCGNQNTSNAEKNLWDRRTAAKQKQMYFS